MQSEIQLDRSIAYVIDDDASVREGVVNLLRSVGIAVETFGSTTEFLRSERPDVPGCLILDVRLPGMSGLEFQSELGRLGIDIPVVFITARCGRRDVESLLALGAAGVISKPFDPLTLATQVIALVVGPGAGAV